VKFHCPSLQLFLYDAFTLQDDWLVFWTLCQYLPTLNNLCTVNVSHYKINSFIKYTRQNQHLTRTYQAVPLHIITRCNQALKPGQIGVLILNPNGRKEAFCALFSQRSYCQCAFTFLCSDYTVQSNAAWGCPITSLYYQRVVLMEFYFHTSPTPWIPGKSSRFYPLHNVHTALWPNQPPVQWAPQALCWGYCDRNVMRPLTPSNSKVNNEWN
jgi:hypothetical protein